jgi:hypothetical protein
METLTPTAMVRMDSPRWRRARIAALVVVDHGPAAAGPTAATGRLQAVLGLADDVPAPVLGQGEGQVQDQGALGVLAGCDAFQHLDRDAALEQVVEDDEPFRAGCGRGALIARTATDPDASELRKS